MAQASDVQTLQTVIGSYPHTVALKAGEVPSRTGWPCASRR